MGQLLAPPRARGPVVPLPRRSSTGTVYTVTIGGAVTEAIGLKAAGLLGALPLAPQATALPPLAAFHDGRWLLVYATSWPVLAAEAAAAVAVRAVLVAAVVRAAWPGPDVPGWATTIRRGALGAAVGLLAMSPWAALSFIGGVVSLSFPILAAVAGTLVMGVLVLPHAGIAPHWWAAWPPWKAMAWTFVSFLLLTATSVAVGYSPGWFVVVTVAAGGAANGWCWCHVVAASAHAAPDRPRWSSSLVPVGVAAALVATVVVLGMVLGTILEVAVPHRRYREPPPRSGARVVLLVDGFESDWNGARPALRFPGFYVTEFSYRGQGSRGRPLAYRSRFTDAPLPVLAAKMARQVARLRRLSGRRIDVVAVSEGTLVLRQYLSEHPGAPLGTVVLGSPLPRPARVSYPSPGRAGWGIAGGAEAGVLTKLVDRVDTKAAIDPSIPMVRSLVAEAPLFRQRSLCPVPGIRVVALLPLSAAVAEPLGPVAGVPDAVVPAIHADLLSLGTTRRLIERVLRGGAPTTPAGLGLAFQILRYASGAWSSPPLALDEVAAWRRDGGARSGDAAFGTYGCPASTSPNVSRP